MGYVTPEIRKRVDDKVAENIATASSFFNRPFSVPRIRYNLSGTTAGTASYNDHEIDLNYVLLQRETEYMVSETVPHEVAHLITGIVYPITKGSMRHKGSPHGPEWQSVMRVLGVEPSRCHNLDVSDLKRVTSRTRNIAYVCTGCKSKVRLSMKSVAALKRDPTSLWHRGCKGWKLVPAGEVISPVAPAAPVIYTPPVAPPPVTPRTIAALMPQAPVPTAPVSQNGGSKLNTCETIYLTNPGVARADMLRRFMLATGIGQAHAATYYQTIKKRHGG